ncbi:hypothetical protein CU254_00380 [Amycolatopsis sp. AA4]|uniref:hypothetical protein n=1 Tax=Actinomycetes TaxID=1760 RepID=UPI0001B55A0B|nr:MULTISPECIES: hypothetical protein [Actinomycetes]ATY09111.1 hypothetical protein CU254_00380 [Amycolatopsis sp. AA4]EFL04401.1 hypothetical protein SSMG_00072 [Streptomyces sp. AA4]
MNLGQGPAASVAPSAIRAVRAAIAESSAVMVAGRTLGVPDPVTIRAGRRGGLPFDSITSDLYLGCLPATQICYGSCFAARGAFAAGYDFGTRVENLLDPDVLRADLLALPAEQRFLRNGWNSDASWNWPKARLLAELVRDSGRCTVFVTKYFRSVDADSLAGLAGAGAELRVSVSAMDTPGQLRQRLAGMLAYRDAGGTAVPVVMSSVYADERLNRRQDELVDWIEHNDLPGAENSLRFPQELPAARLVDRDRVGVLDGSGDLWAGRLYCERLPVPTITSVPAGYPGLPWRRRSSLDLDQLEAWRQDPVRTHDEVMSGARLAKPRKCGVVRTWLPDPRA